ncbi:MAG: carboxylating nicotinate-nucleotide diphosphorylase [Myxococcota bacterium]
MTLDPLSKRLVALALEEDIGAGDVTSVVVDEEVVGQAHFVAREALCLAGTAAAEEVYAQIDPQLAVRFARTDGAWVEAGERFGTVRGPSRSLLMGERTALNFLQRLSSIATRARSAQAEVAGTRCRVVDTRKTTPGLRALEKAAVRAGGAFNHRSGLFDGILIKDNHIAAVGSVTAAITKARTFNHHLLKIECECDTLAQVEEAVEAGADVILLDNMTDEQMRVAVQRVGGRALVEASGGVRQERLASIAATGVDFISMGGLTHSAQAADIGLDWD